MRKVLLKLGVVVTSGCLLLGCAEIGNESSSSTTSNEETIFVNETVEEPAEENVEVSDQTENTMVAELPVKTEQGDESEETEEINATVENVETGESAEITESEEAVIEVEEKDVITELDKIMYASNRVNLRSGNSTAYEIVGGLSQNEEVHVIGQSSKTGWYLIEYGESTAYVSNNYLSDTKVEIVQVEENVAVNNQETAQNVPQNVGDEYIEVQLWDYTPENGAYFKEKISMPVEECIQWVMNTTGATRQVAEDSVRGNIKIRKNNPNYPTYTIHTEALVNHNGGKESYWRWQ